LSSRWLNTNSYHSMNAIRAPTALTLGVFIAFLLIEPVPLEDLRTEQMRPFSFQSDLHRPPEVSYDFALREGLVCMSAAVTSAIDPRTQSGGRISAATL
jgi:hypothetical protein